MMPRVRKYVPFDPILVVALALIIGLGVMTTPVRSQEPMRESRSQHDARMQWWREARFGLFIHWGLYAVPAGEWNGQKDYGEWIRTSAQIPLTEYDHFRGQFNPAQFDARAWVRAAKSAGMKYIVITSKHHDGFCLFTTSATDFNVMSTPFHRDILKELSEACHAEGMPLCFYYSIMDWHHPDYLPRREWEKSRTTAGADFDRYVAYMKRELKELLTNYGPIGVLWFDGEWESTWNHDRGNDLYAYVRSLQPGIIINNRVGAGRTGMSGFNEAGEFAGDFGTPEQEVPSTGLPDVDWETCMTMNDHWGYNRADMNFKSADSLIHTLVDVASKGGNLLLNVGPTSQGVFPAASTERLIAIGKWMAVNGESIHGTTASMFGSTPWGRCTVKKLEGGKWRIYFHIFNRLKQNLFVCSGIGSFPIADRVRMLADPAEPLHWMRSGDTLSIELPKQSVDATDEVVMADFVGKPIVYRPPVIHAPSPIFIDRMDVALSDTDSSGEIRYTLDGPSPNANSPIYRGPITLDRTYTLAARLFADGRPVGDVVMASFEKKPPQPAVAVGNVAPGLEAEYAEGDWDLVPSFDTLKVLGKSVVPVVDLRSRKENEHFGLRFSGYLTVPVDGVYHIGLTSDDGSAMAIDGATVIENDGLHGSLRKEAFVPLAKGPHPMSIRYFNKTGGLELRLQWGKPGEELLDVDSTAFSHGLR